MTTTFSIKQIIDALRGGDPVESERLARATLHQHPDDEDALMFLAISLQSQNRRHEAVPLYARLTELFPQSALHWGNYANVLRGQGRLREATEACATALRLAPDDVEQLINLGLVQLQQRDYVAARETLFKAHALDPDSIVATIHAARACSECRDYRADDLISPWRQWLPLEDDLQLELAALQMALGYGDAARILLEDVVQRAPTNLRALTQLANVYERINRLQDAEPVLARLEALQATLDEHARSEIRHQRATLLLRQGGANAARAILEQVGPRHEGDYGHFFALAEVCDKQRDTQAAMRALQIAHDLQLDELRQIMPHRFEPDAPILPAAVHRISAEEYRTWPQLQAPDAAQSPIFIVGFPRSGTTLLEQMLDAHPGLQSMDERPFFYMLANQIEEYGVRVPQDLHRLSQRDCDELRKGYLTLACSKVPRRWGAQLVDKNPMNMLWLPMIHRLFPQAKFILALRHPCDVLLSNYMQNFRSPVLALACATLEHLAKAYITAMEYWLHHVELFKPELLVSRYEDLIANPVGHTQRIAQFLGLDDPQPMLRFDQHARDKGFIATPSYTQVIQPLSSKAVNRWHRYRSEFERVLPILEPMLEYWGYTTDIDRGHGRDVG